MVSGRVFESWRGYRRSGLAVVLCMFRLGLHACAYSVIILIFSTYIWQGATYALESRFHWIVKYLERLESKQNYLMSSKFVKEVAGAIITTAECREPGSCPLMKQGKITQNLNPKKLRKIQVHQYGQIKGCYSGFQACWVQIWPQFSAKSAPS